MANSIIKPLPHPIHVSTTSIEHSKKDGKLQVICTMFTDDLEAGLAKQYGGKIDLTRADMHAAMDVLVKKYIAANLDIKTPAGTATLHYLGFEINREATDVYLESDAIPAPQKVTVQVSLLQNLFDDEINIVHIIVNGLRKSEKLDYPDKLVTQVF
ncbi:DUF6702 family protein [Mucilaginibacter sp.]